MKEAIIHLFFSFLCGAGSVVVMKMVIDASLILLKNLKRRRERMMKDEEPFGEYVKIHGVKYKLQFDNVEVHSLICTRCGHPVELHNGWGSCPNCGTVLMAIKEGEE